MCCTLSVLTVEVDQPFVVDKLEYTPIILGTRRLNLVGLYMKLILTFTTMTENYALLDKNPNALKVVVAFALALYEMLDKYNSISKGSRNLSVKEIDEFQLEVLCLTSF